MDKEELAQDILEFLGNRENIGDNYICLSDLECERIFSCSKSECK